MDNTVVLVCVQRSKGSVSWEMQSFYCLQLLWLLPLFCMFGEVLSQQQQPLRPVVVDTDGSPDDLIALALIVKQQQATNTALQLVTVTGVGWGHLAPATQNVRNFLGLIGAGTVPVVSGAGTTLTEAADATNGRCSTISVPAGGRGDGVSDQHRHTTSRFTVDTLFGLAAALPRSRGSAQGTDAVSALRDLLSRTTVPIFYIALGGATNLAQCLSGLAAQQSSAFVSKIDSVHFSGGATAVYPRLSFSKSPFAEFHMYIDPVAADTLLHTAGLNVVIYPYNLSSSITVQDVADAILTGDASQGKGRGNGPLSYWLTTLVSTVKADVSKIAFETVFTTSEIITAVCALLPSRVTVTQPQSLRVETSYSKASYATLLPDPTSTFTATVVRRFDIGSVIATLKQLLAQP